MLVKKRIDLKPSFASDVLYSLKKSWRLYIAYPLCLGMLEDMYLRSAWYGDVTKTTYNILSQHYQIRPSESLVRNMGYDGSGLHCGSADIGFSTQPLSNRSSYYINTQSKGKFQSWNQLYFQGINLSKIRSLLLIIKIWIRYMVFRVKARKYNRIYCSDEKSKGN